MNQDRKQTHAIRVLSGIQPTGELHLGNYMGAVRHWVTRQAQVESLFLLADLHAITLPQNPRELRQKTLSTAALLLAAGIDPRTSIIFVQSHIGQHAELAWILSCLTSFGELQRMTQFKDKAARQGGASAGLFTYPVLQAADILLYEADRVPVGEDQKQHLELTRDLAQRFNRRFGPTFKVPEPIIAPIGARIMDLEDPRQKMSKSSPSKQGTIWLTDSPEDIRAKIRQAVTDSGREIQYGPEKPAISNLLVIYSIATESSLADAETAFRGKGYAALKQAVSDALVEYLRPVRERYQRVNSQPDEIIRVLQLGAERASGIAAQTMASVYDHIGLLPP